MLRSPDMAVNRLRILPPDRRPKLTPAIQFCSLLWEASPELRRWVYSFVRRGDYSFVLTDFILRDARRRCPG
jgi:hypothetical protein